MQGWRAAVLILLGGGFAGLSIWAMLASGEIEPLSLVVALFFGGCAVGGVSMIVPTAPPVRDADGSTTIYDSTARCLLNATAMGAIAASSVIAIPHFAEFDGWKKYAFLAIPVPCALLCFKYVQWAFSGAPSYRFDKHGLTRLRWGKRQIAWSDVVGVRMLRTRAGPQVVLDATPAFRKTQPWWAQLGSALGGGDITLSTATFGMRPEAMERLVREYWEARVK